MSIKLSEGNLKSLGVFIAALTILGTMISLDISAYFHLEAALLIVGGTTSYSLIVNKKKSLAHRIGQGAVFFGWLGLLIAGTYVAYNGFYSFSPNELGVAVAYSMHPLLYGYIIKLSSLAFDD
jgi:hypothetical protein|tara:strand:+ start:146 stop:514 length:369 start_codon:yes stop_codon:yes gene_type:complete